MFSFSFFLDTAREFFTYMRFVGDPLLLEEGVTAFVLTGKGEDFFYSPSHDTVIGGIVKELHYTVNFDVETAAGATVPVSHTFLEWYGLSADMAADDLSLTARLDEAITTIDFVKLVSAYTPPLDGASISQIAPTEVYFGDNTQKWNTAYGSPGNDRFVLANEGRSDLGRGDDQAQASGVTNATQVFLRRGDDLYIGDRDAVELEPATAGLKSVYGGLGNDVLLGGGTTDAFRGNRGSDYLKGYEDDDRLFGGAGDDFIFGGTGNDQIYGGVGQDVLRGGAGSDGLRGGLGQDVFWLAIADADTDAALAAQDVIYDFTQGIDHLHVTRSNGDDMTRREAWSVFQEHAVQRGNDTEFTYAGTKTILRDTSVKDFRLNSFYDKPWLLEDVDSAFNI